MSTEMTLEKQIASRLILEGIGTGRYRTRNVREFLENTGLSLEEVVFEEHWRGWTDRNRRRVQRIGQTEGHSGHWFVCEAS